jgi:uncharacterized protein YcfJ
MFADHRRNAAALLALALAATGCSSDDYVRREAEQPSVEAYRADLDTCRSAARGGRATGAAEGFLAGALVGAANGAAAGAAHGGGADLGAAIGAGLGAVIGFAQGLAWSPGSSLDACMHRKGYRRA